MANTIVPTNSSLGHMPGQRWEFDTGVTEVFPDMLRRSIPQYEVMRQAVIDLGSRFVVPHTQIVDLGCARGDALAPFIGRFGDANRHVGVDVSAPMLDAARREFEDEIAAGFVQFADMDLRSDYPPGEASLTLCILTLQFIPVDHRHRILHDVFTHTIPGGALVFVEKVLGATAELGAAMVNLYHSLKTRNGYTAEEIERKRMSLEGVLVPITASWNVEMVRAAGFQDVDCFWRWMNFAGWIAVKSR